MDLHLTTEICERFTLTSDGLLRKKYPVNTFKELETQQTKNENHTVNTLNSESTVHYCGQQKDYSTTGGTNSDPAVFLTTGCRFSLQSLQFQGILSFYCRQVL